VSLFFDGLVFVDFGMYMVCVCCVDFDGVVWFVVLGVVFVVYVLLVYGSGGLIVVGLCVFLFVVFVDLDVDVIVLLVVVIDWLVWFVMDVIVCELVILVLLFVYVIDVGWVGMLFFCSGWELVGVVG